ncbi:MAG: hypothetical protein C5B47_06305, partial [Verrucomicrobia bacterium]
IKKTPEGKKFLGATQIYLWENGLLSPANVKNWSLFLSQLQTGPAAGLRKFLDSETQNLLNHLGTNPDSSEQCSLITGINQALDECARSQWLNEADNMDKIVNSYGLVRKEVAKDFASSLDPNPSEWGITLTSNLFKKLANAGLKRLWLGLGDGWEGGLWHPEAIAAAVNHGFLIAPYDSYETALNAGDNTNNSWTTAHLGPKAAESTGVIQSNGKLQSGFQNSGSYTNPRLVRPLLEARIKAIRKQVCFNSWYLDSYAAGMVFDDYRPGKEMTMAQFAAENEKSSRWVAEALQLPNGSEGGNAITAGGIFFAQGMQTPYFAWQDPELKKKSSPYYLGNWSPVDAPSIYFRATLINEPFRTLYFDPTQRLPLYQAVFHGSVITTHHWAFDNLKLSNVRMENELTQLLYNVPPLYHLSASTLNARLPVIIRQDAFFRPLHEKLAFETLTEFRWLTPDHLVQETIFSDGTRLIANFSEKPYQGSRISVPSFAIAALCLGRAPLIYQSKIEKGNEPNNSSYSKQTKNSHPQRT